MPKKFSFSSSEPVLLQRWNARTKLIIAIDCYCYLDQLALYGRKQINDSSQKCALSLHYFINLSLSTSSINGFKLARMFSATDGNTGVVMWCLLTNQVAGVIVVCWIFLSVVSFCNFVLNLGNLSIFNWSWRYVWNHPESFFWLWELITHQQICTSEYLVKWL